MNNNLNEDIIKQLNQFGYNTKEIEIAIKSVTDPNDINVIVDKIKQSQSYQQIHLSFDNYNDKFDGNSSNKENFFDVSDDGKSAESPQSAETPQSFDDDCKVFTRTLPNKSEFISHSEILSLLLYNTNSAGYIIVDVRDHNLDYSGGHIKDSVHISSESFYEKVPELFAKYHYKCKFILQCMYGVRRSIKCMHFYAKAMNEMIENYSSENGASFYMMNTKKMYVQCNDSMYENLCKQKLFVLQGGFFEFINNPKIDRKNKNILAAFDMSQWDELTVVNAKKLYHKEEYFADSKFQQKPNKTGRISITI